MPPWELGFFGSEDGVETEFSFPGLYLNLVLEHPEVRPAWDYRKQNWSWRLGSLQGCGDALQVTGTSDSSSVLTGSIFS